MLIVAVTRVDSDGDHPMILNLEMVVTMERSSFLERPVVRVSTERTTFYIAETLEWITGELNQNGAGRYATVAGARQ